MRRIIREIFIAFKIMLLDGVRNPLTTLTMLVFYGFFYLIGYFLYGFATNEIEIFQKYLISGFLASSFLLQTGGWWSFILADLKFHGQLEETILSYSHIEIYLLGAVLYATIITFISIFVALVAIYFLFGFPLFHFRLLILFVIFIFAGLSYIYSMMSQALFIMFKENWVVSSITTYMIIVITPIFYPIDFLPTFFQYLAKVFPITWGVELLRSLMYDINNFTTEEMWFYFVLTSILWSIFAFLFWKRAYLQGKKTGLLYSM